MKSLLTNYISSTSEQYIVKESLDQIQAAPKEAIDALVKGLITYTTGDVIIIFGCVLTGSDPGVRTLTAGAIYYNGEIYLVPTASFTTTGSNIPLWTINESFGTVDPIAFSDSVTHSVHSNKQFVLTQGLAGGSGISGYICDYNSAVVKYLLDIWRYDSTIVTSAQIAQTGWTSGVNVTYSSIKAAQRKIGNTVHLSVSFTVTYGATGTGNTFSVTPLLYPPKGSLAYNGSGAVAWKVGTGLNTQKVSYVQLASGAIYFYPISGDSVVNTDAYQISLSITYET